MTGFESGLTTGTHLPEVTTKHQVALENLTVFALLVL